MGTPVAFSSSISPEPRWSSAGLWPAETYRSAPESGSSRPKNAVRNFLVAA